MAGSVIYFGQEGKSWWSYGRISEEGEPNLEIKGLSMLQNVF